MNEQANTDPSRPKFLLDTVLWTVAGHVWQPVTAGEVTSRQPARQASVRIKDSARATETNEKGQFKFKNLRAGAYTLLVQAQNGWGGERTILVPPTYDVEVTAAAVDKVDNSDIVSRTPPPAPPADGSEESPAPEELPMAAQVVASQPTPEPSKTGRKPKRS